MSLAQAQDSEGLSKERFGFTLFLSICVHVMIILGVGFGFMARQPEGPSLDITLAQFHSEQAPEQVDFLAQANQEGSGSLDEASAPATDQAAPFFDEQINEVSPLQPAQQQRPVDARTQTDILTGKSPAEDRVPTPSEHSPENSGDAPETREQRNATLTSLQAQLDLQRQAYAKRPRRHTLSAASTRQARDALYLDTWRKHIETVGNRHYPQAASRDGIYGRLRMMVALRPDGSVSEVRILRSSGQQVLDEAAVRIVHLAAPFEPFPESMRGEVDILEIIRTWQFQQGRTTTSW